MLLLVSTQLNRRFGTLDKSLVDRLQSLGTEQLTALGSELLELSSIADSGPMANQELCKGDKELQADTVVKAQFKSRSRCSDTWRDNYLEGLTFRWSPRPVNKQL